jgi:hypothetical protein
MSLFLTIGKRVRYGGRDATVLDLVGIRAHLAFDRPRLKWLDAESAWVSRDSERFAPVERTVAPATTVTLFPELVS